VSRETGVPGCGVRDIPAALAQPSHAVIRFRAGTVAACGNGVALSAGAFGGQITK